MQQNQKECLSCKKEKVLTDFYVQAKGKYGRSSKCKDCIKIIKTKVCESGNVQAPNEKQCKTCNSTKPISDFSKHNSSPDGFHNNCKICLNERCRELYKKRQENNTIVSDLVNSEKTKMCRKCLEIKPLDNFSVNLRSADKVSGICSDCHQPKKRYSREITRVYEQRYKAKYPEKAKEKEKKQSENINRRVRSACNSRIRKALQLHNNIKNEKTISYIGCTIEFLRDWLEFQFDKEMSWDTYGKWHIDHVKPCCNWKSRN